MKREFITIGLFTFSVLFLANIASAQQSANEHGVLAGVQQAKKTENTVKQERTVEEIKADIRELKKEHEPRRNSPASNQQVYQERANALKNELEKAKSRINN